MWVIEQSNAVCRGGLYALSALQSWFIWLPSSPVRVIVEDVIRMSSLLHQDVLITEQTAACCQQDKEEEIRRGGETWKGEIVTDKISKECCDSENSAKNSEWKTFCQFGGTLYIVVILYLFSSNHSCARYSQDLLSLGSISYGGGLSQAQKASIWKY